MHFQRTSGILYKTEYEKLDSNLNIYLYSLQFGFFSNLNS